MRVQQEEEVSDVVIMKMTQRKKKPVMSTDEEVEIYQMKVVQMRREEWMGMSGEEVIEMKGEETTIEMHQEKDISQEIVTVMPDAPAVIGAETAIAEIDLRSIEIAIFLGKIMSPGLIGETIITVRAKEKVLEIGMGIGEEREVMSIQIDMRIETRREMDTLAPTKRA